MLIPHHMLDPAILENMLEDFVTRDGTDNGFDAPLEKRVSQLKKQLERGEILIVFHPDTGDTSLAHRRDVPPEMLSELNS